MATIDALDCDRRHSFEAEIRDGPISTIGYNPGALARLLPALVATHDIAIAPFTKPALRPRI